MASSAYALQVGWKRQPSGTTDSTGETPTRYPLISRSSSRAPGPGGRAGEEVAEAAPVLTLDLVLAAPEDVRLRQQDQVRAQARQLVLAKALAQEALRPVASVGPPHHPRARPRPPRQ